MSAIGEKMSKFLIIFWHGDRYIKYATTEGWFDHFIQFSLNFFCKIGSMNSNLYALYKFYSISILWYYMVRFLNFKSIKIPKVKSFSLFNWFYLNKCLNSLRYFITLRSRETVQLNFDCIHTGGSLVFPYLSCAVCIP